MRIDSSDAAGSTANKKRAGCLRPVCSTERQCLTSCQRRTVPSLRTGLLQRTVPSLRRGWQRRTGRPSRRMGSPWQHKEQQPSRHTGLPQRTDSRQRKEQPCRRQQPVHRLRRLALRPVGRSQQAPSQLRSAASCLSFSWEFSPLYFLVVAMPKGRCGDHARAHLRLGPTQITLWWTEAVAAIRVRNQTPKK